MADNSSGLPVLTIGAGSSAATQYVGVKIFDSAGTNQLAVNANNALKADLANYSGTATGAGNAVHVQPGTSALFSVGATAAALGDGTANPSTNSLGAYLEGFNGTTWDRIRTTDAYDGTGAITTTGVLLVGSGPGFNRRFNPANLGTVVNNVSAVNVNGAGTASFGINTATTGTFTFEVTSDNINWVAAIAYDLGTTTFVTGTNLTPTVGKTYLLATTGQRQARIRTVTTLGVTVAHFITLDSGEAISIGTTVASGTQNVNLTQVGGAAIALGQAAMASSLPVVIASNQTNLPTNIAQYLGATASATNPVDVRLSTGAGAYTLFGQANTTAPFTRITDGTTNVAVIVGTTALKTDLSSVAGTATVSGGIAGSVGTGGLAASGAAKGGNPVQTGGVFNTTQPTVTTGQAVELQATARGALIIASGVDSIAVTPAANSSVNLAQVAGTNTVTGGLAGSQGVGGLAASGAAISGNPLLIGGTFTTAQPTVTTGQAVNLQTDNRGALMITTGVNTPAFNLTQVGGSAISATVPVSSRLTDGTAFYTRTGQTAGTAVFSAVNDGTTTAVVTAGITALKVDVAGVRGAVDSATQALSVRLTDGSSFYSAGSTAPSAPFFSTQTSAALGAGASVTLTHFVTSTKTGQLYGADVASTVPLKIEVGTILTGAFTARSVLFAQPYSGVQWRAPYQTFITRASADASTGFGVRVTNKDATVAADVYSTGYWNEV